MDDFVVDDAAGDLPTKVPAQREVALVSAEWVVENDSQCVEDQGLPLIVGLACLG